MWAHKLSCGSKCCLEEVMLSVRPLSVYDVEQILPCGSKLDHVAQTSGARLTLNNHCGFSQFVACFEYADLGNLSCFYIMRWEGDVL